MNLLLQHTPQPSPWGCQYYALYSLVGDERILADVTECSTGRFTLLMQELGYHLHVLWLDQTEKCPTAPVWWQGVFDRSALSYYIDEPPVIPLLVDIATRGLPAVVRRVGVAVTFTYGLPVVVFDTANAEPLCFETLEEFGASPYGRCYGVYEVAPARELDFFEPVYGPDLRQVPPPARVPWETTRGVRVN